MIITKSKYVEYIKCSRLSHLKDYFSEHEKTSSFDDELQRVGIEVGKIARNYFGDYVLVDDFKNRLQQTNDYLKAGHKVIAEAAFLYNDLFCAVDLLKVEEDGVEIYEVKSTTNVEKSHIDDVSFQTYVLKKLGYNVKNSYVLCIDKGYVLEDELEINKFFQKNIILPKTDVEQNLDRMRHDLVNLPALSACANCKPKKCGYFNYCYGHLPENNIFTLAGYRSSPARYNEGIVTFEDILNSGVLGAGTIDTKAKEQIEYELNDCGLKSQKDKVKKFLDTLVYPLYYLDFETYKYVIPQYKGYYPNFVQVVQYSLHIQQTPGGELEHKEYLLTEAVDNKEEIAKKLIADLGEEGSIIVYHKSFEGGRIADLSEVVPEYKNELLSLIDRLVDLEEPFVNRYVYNKKMKGFSSIKYVLPALCEDFEESYKNLEYVHNGGDAMAVYQQMLHSTGEEKQNLIKGLLDYCCLDTLAMVEILKKLIEISK